MGLERNSLKTIAILSLNISHVRFPLPANPTIAKSVLPRPLAMCAASVLVWFRLVRGQESRSSQGRIVEQMKHSPRCFVTSPV